MVFGNLKVLYISLKLKATWSLLFELEDTILCLSVITCIQPTVTLGFFMKEMEGVIYQNGVHQPQFKLCSYFYSHYCRLTATKHME